MNAPPVLEEWYRQQPEGVRRLLRGNDGFATPLIQARLRATFGCAIPDTVATLPDLGAWVAHAPPFACISRTPIRFMPLAALQRLSQETAYRLYPYAQVLEGGRHRWTSFFKEVKESFVYLAKPLPPPDPIRDAIYEGEQPALRITENGKMSLHLKTLVLRDELTIGVRQGVYKIERVFPLVFTAGKIENKPTLAELQASFLAPPEDKPTQQDFADGTCLGYRNTTVSALSSEMQTQIARLRAIESPVRLLTHNEESEHWGNIMSFILTLEAQAGQTSPERNADAHATDNP